MVFLLLINISSFETFFGYTSSYFGFSEVIYLFTTLRLDIVAFLSGVLLFVCQFTFLNSCLINPISPINFDVFDIDLVCATIFSFGCSPCLLDSITLKLSRWLLSLVVIDKRLLFLPFLVSSTVQGLLRVGDFERKEVLLSGDLLRLYCFFSVDAIGLSYKVDLLGFKTAVRLFFKSRFLDVRG